MPEYILTLKIWEYCLRTALVLRWYSHTLNPIYTLNIFVETFFRQFFFGLPSFFLSCAKRPIESLNNLTFQTRKTVLPKQVFVIQRGKRECEDFLSFIIRLNKRKSPSATLVSKEKITILDRRFSKSRGFSRSHGRSYSSRRLWGCRVSSLSS